MAKFHLRKKSKRQPARLRYKIEKKVREHNRKVRKEAKKNPKSKRPKLIQVPNICPFKEDILKEAEEYKARREQEKKDRREALKKERNLAKTQQKKSLADGGLAGLVANAEVRGKIHDAFKPTFDRTENERNPDNSLKAYYKEFRKVVEAADVILEVLDARDPLGTRCTQVEQAVHESAGNKRLVLVLNKADLVPRAILDKWLVYLRRSTPAIAFKASTQNQGKRLGRKKMPSAKVSDKSIQSSICVGAELLMSLLGNYCRNKGIKTSIRVGVVGLPNVGKSSIINSLKRSRACGVGSTPGITKQMQEVQLDSKIKLLDSPGIVFASSANSSSSTIALKNAVSIGVLKDPFTPATAILQRANKKQLMEMYNISDFDTPQEFFALKAAQMGRYKKGGVPDAETAARGVLEDWNHGKIKYYTLPPETDDAGVHLSSKIISEVGKEFDIASFETMETEELKELGTSENNEVEAIIIESSGPVTAEEDKMEEDTDVATSLISDKVNIEPAPKKEKKTKEVPKVKSKNNETDLDGNQKINKVKKAQFKKDRKARAKKEKVALALSSGLENISIDKDEDYDFETDFKD